MSIQFWTPTWFFYGGWKILKLGRAGDIPSGANADDVGVTGVLGSGRGNDPGPCVFSSRSVRKMIPSTNQDCLASISNARCSAQFPEFGPRARHLRRGASLKLLLKAAVGKTWAAKSMNFRTNIMTREKFRSQTTRKTYLQLHRNGLYRDQKRNKQFMKSQMESFGKSIFVKE